MKTKSLLMLAVLALLATVGFTSCDELAMEDNPMQSYITMRTSDVTLKVGETYVRKAVAAGTAVVVYSSSDATVATVDQAGTVTAVAAGTATITAQTTGYNAEGKKIYLAEEKSYKVTVKPATLPAAAWAANEYNEGSWDGTKVVFTKQTAASVTAVANSTAAVIWSAGWYTVSGNVTITGNVTLGANTHLILQDGAKLTINGRILGSSKNLSIYGQANQTGQLVVNYSNNDAIRSIITLEVHGCQVTATSSSSSCSGFDNIGLFNVYGGSVDAENTGTNGNGIYLDYNGSMNIYGGDVKAVGKGSGRQGITGSSSTVTVYGGKLWAENAGNKALYGVTLTKDAGFTGKIETSGDGSSWTDWTTTGTPSTKYVRVGY